MALRRLCAVDGCSSDSNLHPELSFFNLPKCEKTKAQWLQLIWQSDPPLPMRSTVVAVCEKHFEKTCTFGKVKRLMKATTLPTLFLPDRAASSSPARPLHATEPQICLNEKLHDNTVQIEFVPEIKNDLQIKTKPRKNKYSTEFKMLALDLYFRSPCSYRVLQSSFGLPRISTLYRLCIPMTTELSVNLLKALSTKVDCMTASQKQCVVCVGVTNVTPHIEYDPKSDKIRGLHEMDGVQMLKPASLVLVVMVRGLFHNWKQALTYALLGDRNDRVKAFIYEIVAKLFQIGLDVRAVISDLECNVFTGATGKINNIAFPYTIINERKVYHMYDPLHMMKNVRDNMMNYTIMFGTGSVANWQHIEKCYKYEQGKGEVKLAPKLSSKHFTQEPPLAMSVLDELKSTTEVFSKSTAAALNAYIDQKVISIRAKSTVTWIITINKLMEMLNFSQTYPPEDKSAVFSGESLQVQFLESIIPLLHNLRMVSTNLTAENVAEEVTSTAKFIEGLRMTIIAFLLLRAELKNQHCPNLPFVGISNDCIDQFFDKVYKKPRSGNLTATEVISCMRQCPIGNIFQYTCRKRRANDLEFFMSRVREFSNINVYEDEPAEVNVEEYANDIEEFSSLDLPIMNRLLALARYLINKACQQHKDCFRMMNFANVNTGGSGAMEATRSDALNTLLPQNFIKFIKRLESKFKQYFKENRLARSVSGLENYAKNVTFDIPCECFPLDYVKKLFFRLRMHLLIEYNNKYFTMFNSEKFVIQDL